MSRYLKGCRNISLLTEIFNVNRHMKPASDFRLPQEAKDALQTDTLLIGASLSMNGIELLNLPKYDTGTSWGIQEFGNFSHVTIEDAYVSYEWWDIYSKKSCTVQPVGYQLKVKVKYHYRKDLAPLYKWDLEKDTSNSIILHQTDSLEKMLAYLAEKGIHIKKVPKKDKYLALFEVIQDLCSQNKYRSCYMSQVYPAYYEKLYKGEHTPLAIQWTNLVSEMLEDLQEAGFIEIQERKSKEDRKFEIVKLTKKGLVRYQAARVS